MRWSPRQHVTESKAEGHTGSTQLDILIKKKKKIKFRGGRTLKLTWLRKTIPKTISSASEEVVIVIGLLQVLNWLPRPVRFGSRSYRVFQVHREVLFLSLCFLNREEPSNLHIVNALG